VLTLPENKTLTLDAVYTHDAMLPTSQGLILMRPGKSTRIPEAHAQAAFCAQQNVPTFAEIQAPATTEAGDVVWLDARTLLVGQGFRTNKAGLDQLRALLAPRVDVLPAPLPHGQGPSACLHLMSLMSVLDDRTILVDHRLTGLLMGQTLHTKAHEIYRALIEAAYRCARRPPEVAGAFLLGASS